MATTEAGICKVKTSKVDVRTGQAEIETKGAPLLLNVRTRGEDVLKRGEEAIVVEHDAAHQIYRVKKLEIERTI